MEGKKSLYGFHMDTLDEIGDVSSIISKFLRSELCKIMSTHMIACSTLE